MRTGILLLLMVLMGVQLQAQTRPVYEARIDTIYKNIYAQFYFPSVILYSETNDDKSNEKLYSYLWPLCALIQATNEMEVLQPDKRCMQPVMQAIQKYYNNTAPAPGYQAYVWQAGRDTRYYDDNEWIAIAYMDAYRRTKDSKFLQLSQEIYRFLMTGYDAVSGGGLYWREGDASSKNACSNGPGLLVALQLYNATQQQSYLDTAMLLYKWTNQHLQAPSGIYYDAIRVPGLRIDSTTFTYNTGTMLQANVLLYHITKDKQYLHEATRIATAAKARFFRNGSLPGNYWFNVVLLRGCIELYKVDGNKEWIQYHQEDAERIWRTERDAQGLMGRKPVKSLIDQAAMIEYYALLAQVFSEKALRN